MISWINRWNTFDSETIGTAFSRDLPWANEWNVLNKFSAVTESRFDVSSSKKYNGGRLSGCILTQKRLFPSPEMSFSSAVSTITVFTRVIPIWIIISVTHFSPYSFVSIQGEWNSAAYINVPYTIKCLLSKSSCII